MDGPGINDLPPWYEDKLRKQKLEGAARRWCARHGYEFKSWDGTFCSYRDPQMAGTSLEFGLESWIEE